ncbi:24394_t:CDS:1, partial [Racocetra persica]
LPLLAHDQTIQTLIQHIDKYNNNKTVSSITFSVNSSYDETHIYLPNDTLLPDHIVIAPHLLPIFYNLPLRSNFINPTSISSDLFFDNHSSTSN